MGADDEDLDAGRPEEELRRMSPRRRGARGIGREQAIPILFVVVAVVLLLWWLIALRGQGSPQVVAPTPTRGVAAIATPVVTLALTTPQAITSTGSLTVSVPTTQTVTTPAAPSGPLAEGMTVLVTGTGVDQLSLRGGPGINNARLKLLPDGTKLKVVGGPEEADCGGTDLCKWWRLETQDGTTGWAIEGKLTPVNQ